nr:glutamine-hydrolyzing GMP synthase [Spirochaeta sp.]
MCERILDFGSQTTQLIGRRIREIGVYSEIAPGDAKLWPLMKEEVRGVILSGSPASVYDKDAPLVDPYIYELPVPVLGICYGAQRMIQDRGGRVSSLENREYGRARIKFLEQSAIFSGLAEGFTSWMSHGDSIELLPGEFRTAAVTENGLPALILHEQKRIMGLQFHPEVSHCEGGLQILENFALKICGARRQWNMEIFLNKACKELQERVGGNKVLLLISGGVDSTVAAALLLKALPAEQVHLMYIDTGLMRL